MQQEKYSLTWHTYSDHLKNMMKELMMNEDFSDVTLVTDDKKQIKANINILSACSPLFKDILKNEKNSNQIIYLRGIQFFEMESIMQFIYLGEATFNEERMNEFLSVAKTLEIKELCNAELETNDDPNNEPSPSALTENLSEETAESVHVNKQTKRQYKKRVVHANGGVKYACNQCDYLAGYPIGLTRHIESQHEGVKYTCDKCDYQAKYKVSLTRHIQSVHEGVKYDCDQCDYQNARQDKLNLHIKSFHEGGKHACDQCDYHALYQRDLKVHIQTKHQICF